MWAERYNERPKLLKRYKAYITRTIGSTPQTEIYQFIFTYLKFYVTFHIEPTLQLFRIIVTPFYFHASLSFSSVRTFLKVSLRQNSNFSTQSGPRLGKCLSSNGTCRFVVELPIGMLHVRGKGTDARNDAPRNRPRLCIHDIVNLSTQTDIAVYTYICDLYIHEIRQYPFSYFEFDDRE